MRDSVGATKGAPGLAFLFVAVGSVPAMLLTGRELDRRGTRILPWLLAGLAAAAVLPAFAGSVAALAAGLRGIGVFSGATDVAMNAAVSELEARRETRLMQLAHALRAAARRRVRRRARRPGRRGGRAERPRGGRGVLRRRGRDLDRGADALRGRRRGASPEARGSAVATLGYLGFLVGPPAVGGVAELVGLRDPFVVLAVVAAALVAAKPRLGLRGRDPGTVPGTRPL